MTKRIVVLCVSWVVATTLCAYSYAGNRVSSPQATPGYETDWTFQFLMFSIFRLPFFVVLLALLVWATVRHGRIKR